MLNAATIVFMTFRVIDNSDSCLLNIVQQCNLMLMALNYINKNANGIFIVRRTERRFLQKIGPGRHAML